MPRQPPSSSSTANISGPTWSWTELLGSEPGQTGGLSIWLHPLHSEALTPRLWWNKFKKLCQPADSEPGTFVVNWLRHRFALSRWLTWSMSNGTREAVGGSRWSGQWRGGGVQAQFWDINGGVLSANLAWQWALVVAKKTFHVKCAGDRDSEK